MMKCRCLLLCVFLGSTVASLEAKETRGAAASPELVQTARAIQMGDTLYLEGLELADPGDILQLRRFQVFADDARILVHTKTGITTIGPPDNAYFTGSITGWPQSRASLTVLADGTMRGLVALAGKFWMLASDANGLQANLLDEEQTRRSERSFLCDAEQLSETEALTTDVKIDRAKGFTPSLGTTANYSVRLAVESDHEFYQLFGDATATVDYIADIVSFSSGIYEAEVDTNLVLGDVSIWETSADPYSQSSSLCALYEFGGYWNTNHNNTARSIAHFFSGKSSGGGIAWVGVLCRDSFNTDTGSCGLTPQTGSYGGAYGFTGGMDGDFTIATPNTVWDIVAVTHEIGHNFSSPHTHCYADIGGNPDPVDQCYGNQNSCYSGSASLPCPTAGAGCGTLMSYCHLLSGGLSNMGLTLGMNHPHGIAPERVPAKMNEHVLLVAATNPGCLTTACSMPVVSSVTGGGAVCEGESTTFTVNATGATSYQWRLNSTPLVGATSSSYTIDAVAGGQAGDYDCEVSNDCGTVVSETASLAVNDVVVVTSQPDSLNRCVGTSASFTVSATASGQLSYQWQKNGIDIPGATSPTLTINPVLVGDAGDYRCEVEGLCPAIASSAATLTVNSLLSISEQPSSLSRCLGQNATLEVSASGFGTLAYQWFHDGQLEPGATSSTLVLADLLFEDAGDYTCIVTDGCGNLTSNAGQLTISESPNIQANPNAASRCQGDSVTFTVTATGANLTYQWQLDSDDIQGANQASYTLNLIAPIDAGEYTCVVGSDCGTSTTSPATLTVTEGAFTVSATANSLVQGLQLITLSADVSCAAIPELQWWDLTNNNSYGEGINPLSLPAFLEETTLFEVRVNNGIQVIEAQVQVTATANAAYRDLNGDGCNDIEDLYYILEEWLQPTVLDANGDGNLNVLDMLNVNTSGTGACP